MKRNATDQSPHWVDQIVGQILKWQTSDSIVKLHVDDMKTPSGRVHVGSLLGVVLHDLIARALTSRTSQPVTNTYVFNDFDPMDGLPTYLNHHFYQAHLGKPLFLIPPPPLKESGLDLSQLSQQDRVPLQSSSSFAEFYAHDFIQTLRHLGCQPQVIWSHQLYQTGQMDVIIRETLDKAEIVRQVYQEIADYHLPEQWWPFQAICPQCGRLSTTTTTAWDGNLVTFECRIDKVNWTQGCGYRGQVSPFGGTGKLPWKVDWPAHWKVLGVTIEGAGKDHSTAGGSRDMAVALCQRVFNIPAPFNIPYEWILVKGTKMSSSQGIGTSAREFIQLFPPQVGRFLLAHKHYNQVLDFDPSTMAIPDWFDWYDQGARIHWQQATGDLRLGRSFELSQIGPQLSPHFLPRFRDVALWMQYPEINLIEKFSQIKGSKLDDIEQQVLRERQDYARLWLDRYAPSDFKVNAAGDSSIIIPNLTTDQITFLIKLSQLLASSSEWSPDDLQTQIYNLAKQGIGPQSAFQAVYILLLGKTAGPRAAWLLLQDPELLPQKLQLLQSLNTKRNEAKLIK